MPAAAWTNVSEHLLHKAPPAGEVGGVKPAMRMPHDDSLKDGRVTLYVYMHHLILHATPAKEP